MDHRTEWARDEHNPDFNLVVLNAANKDFQSKCDSTTGSFFITKFVTKIKENNVPKCCWKNKKWLSEIMGEIQVELHQNKQLPVFTFNNPQMRNIVFMKNTGARHIEYAEEMVYDTDEERRGLNEEKDDDEDHRDEIELEQIYKMEIDYLNQIGEIVNMNANGNTADGKEDVGTELNETQQNYGEVLNNLGIQIENNNVINNNEADFDVDEDNEIGGILNVNAMNAQQSISAVEESESFKFKL